MASWVDNESTPKDIQTVWNYLIDGRAEDAFEISAGLGMQGGRVAHSLMALSVNGMLLARKTDRPHKYYLVQSGDVRESNFEVNETHITRILDYLRKTRFATASEISKALEMQQIHVVLALTVSERKGVIKSTSDHPLTFFIPPHDPYLNV